MTIRMLAACLLWTAGASAQVKVIKMGTLAPDRSPWHQVLQQMGEKWRNLSGGSVRLNIYAGGTLGDEPDMVNKMRIGQIQAVALSGAGMAVIEPNVMCLQLPLMFNSYEELDYVRDRMAPKLEKMIEDRGFLVLNWGDAGWVHFFSKTPVTKMDDMRRLKLFTWAGDNDTLELWKTNGFRAVPLAATDILTGLKTGLIEVVPTTPLYALLNQSFAESRFMIDMKWAPLVGATMVTKQAWEGLPADKRAEMLKVAREAGESMRGGIRKMGDDAVATMQKYKLQVVNMPPADLAQWRKEAETIYPKLRGKLVRADLFDEVKRLRDEYRAARPGASK